jgi:hypothetical protein
VRYEKHPLELEELLLLATQMRWLALTNKKEMRNPKFWRDREAFGEVFFIVRVILNGTITDCGCGVAFAIYASTAFRIVKHRVKNGMEPLYSKEFFCLLLAIVWMIVVAVSTKI